MESFFLRGEEGAEEHHNMFIEDRSGPNIYYASTSDYPTILPYVL